MSETLDASASTDEPTDEAAVTDDAFEGDLADKPIYRVLVEAHDRKLTGDLRLERGEDWREIHLQDGSPVLVTEAQPKLRFGDMLVQAQALSEEDLMKGLKTAKERGQRLGRVLLELELVPQPMMEQVLQYQTEGRLADVFGWPEGRYHFEAHELEDVDRIPCEVRLPRVLFVGLTSFYPYESIEKRVSANEAKYPHVPVPEVLGAIPLNEPTKRFLEFTINGKRSLSGCLRETKLRKEAVFRLLHALEILGILAYSDGPVFTKG